MDSRCFSVYWQMNLQMNSQFTGKITYSLLADDLINKMSEETKITEQEVAAEQSPEAQITTTEKPKEKDPKRVAAGKRLAAISKAAKEKKMRELLEAENSSLSYPAISPIAVGIGFLGFVAYKYFFGGKKPDAKRGEADEPDLQKVHMTPRNEAEKEVPDAKKKQRGKPISMFD